MLNITNIEDALYVWAFGVTGLETIFAHPNAPRPITPYVLLNVVQSTPIGIEEDQSTLLVDDSIDIDYSNVELLMVSVNTYRGTALQTATKLKDSLARVTVQDQLFAAGIGYSRTTAVNETPEEINKQWEERARFDCFFFTRSLDSENIATIRQIQLTNELDNTTTVIKHPSIP